MIQPLFVHPFRRLFVNLLSLCRPALTGLALLGSLAPAFAQAPIASAAAVEAAKEAGAVVRESGLVFLSLQEGKGAKPTARDVVTVHYRGVLADAGPRKGEEFDSSYSRGQPASFPLQGVIPCWTEGLQGMAVGGKARLTCPPHIAYGARGAGRGVIPPNATLTFEVELLAIGGR